MLLGTDNMIALPVIRILGKLLPNATLHTLSYDDAKRKKPEYSKYVFSRHYLNPENKKELFEELVSIIKTTEAKILLPIDERDVRNLSSMQDELRKHVYLPPLPETTIFDTLVYKDRLADFLKNHHFPYASTYRLNRLNLSEIDNDFYPYLLKPIRGSSGQKIKKINSEQELGDTLLRLNAKNYILQEIIPGKNIGCSLLAVDGEIKAQTIQEGLFSRDFNFSTAIKFVENETVSELTAQIIKTVGYSGLANLDFRLDERDGQPKLIDFNARFWSNISGSKAAGVNFVQLSCLAAMNIPFKKPDCNGSTYLMGRNSLDYYRKKILKPFSNSASGAIYTDLWERIHDPLPEIVRFMR